METRRRRRVLVKVGVGLSLLLFLALLLAWGAALVLSVISTGASRHWGPYVAWRDGPMHGYALMVTRGGLSVESRSLPWIPKEWPSRGIYEPSPRNVLENADRVLVRLVRIRDGGWLGFEKGHWVAVVGDGFVSGPVRGDYVSVPVWFLLAVLGAGPLAWGVGAVRARRRKRYGLCRRCGYDLRATPGRCPECGARREG